MIARLLQAGSSGAARAVGARAVSILATFILTLLLARLLGPEEAGAYFLVSTTVAIVATLGRFGTDNLALKICGKADSNIRRDIWHSTLLVLLVSAVSAFIVVTLVASVGNQFVGIDFSLLVVAAIAVPAQALTVLAGAVLRGRDKLSLGTFAELGSIPIPVFVKVNEASVSLGG